jgi:lysozyme
VRVIDEARPILADLLRREEGLRLKPYLCSAGVPTIGVGATTYPDGRKVRMDDPAITEEEALRMLAIECDRYMMDVLNLCTRYPSAHQLAAMSSLAYNIGAGAFARSTVLRLHNAGDAAGAARAFALWNKARVDGHLTALRGLTARRAREAALYLTKEPDDIPDAPVQAVADESRLTRSPIAQGGGVAAAGGTALGLLQVQESVTQASTVVDTSAGMLAKVREVTGVDPGVLLAVAVAGAGVYVMVWRKRQRDGGWT